MMDRCPKCGSDDGLYTKTVVRILIGYDFAGNCVGEIGERETVAGYNRPRKINRGQSVYCRSCNKRIGYLDMERRRGDQ